MPGQPTTAIDLWRVLAARVLPEVGGLEPAVATALQTILTRGPLARRMLDACGVSPAPSDLPRGFRQRREHDVARRAFGRLRALERAHRRARAIEPDAAAGEHALLHRRARRGERIFQARAVRVDLELRRAARVQHRDAAREAAETRTQHVARDGGFGRKPGTVKPKGCDANGNPIGRPDW